jgi:hypothetical protein
MFARSLRIGTLLTTRTLHSTARTFVAVPPIMEVSLLHIPLASALRFSSSSLFLYLTRAKLLQILQTPLKEADPEISSILAHEVQRQKESIVLIASEV